MAKGSSSKASTRSADLTTEDREGPEARGQRSADTLEEAMAMQDKLAREGNEELTEEQSAEKAAKRDEVAQEIEEAGKAQEARDDEVYGRVAGAEDRRPGIGETATPETEEQAAQDAEVAAGEADTGA